MKNILLLGSVLLLGTISVKTATLSGTLRDLEGAVIGKAHVVVLWDSNGSNHPKNNIGITQDMTATTDSNGEFSLDLTLGFHDVFVTAISFSPHCDTVRLKGNEVKKYEVRLKVSPVTSKELD